MNNLPAVVDFPTPPFPDATTITCLTPAMGNFLGSPRCFFDPSGSFSFVPGASFCSNVYAQTFQHAKTLPSWYVKYLALADEKHCTGNQNWQEK